MISGILLDLLFDHVIMDIYNAAKSKIKQFDDKKTFQIVIDDVLLQYKDEIGEDDLYDKFLKSGHDRRLYIENILRTPFLSKETGTMLIEYISGECNVDIDNVVYFLEILFKFLFETKEYYGRIEKYRINSEINEIHENSKKLLNENMDIKYRYGEGFNENKEIVLPQKDITLPSKEIITNIITVNHSLLSKIKGKEDLIHKLTPREFEELVCEILEKNGLTVKLTKQTNDGGKDIIVCEEKILGNFLTYVECKKYRRDRPVSIALVRELYGTVMADNATAGLLVTTSYFSRNAEIFTEKNRNRIALMDYNGLVEIIKNTNI